MARITARFALQGQPPKRVLGYRMFQVLEYVKVHVAEHHVSPSYAVICDALGIEKGNLVRMVDALERRGHLTRIKPETAGRLKGEATGTGRIRLARFQ